LLNNNENRYSVILPKKIVTEPAQGVKESWWPSDRDDGTTQAPLAALSTVALKAQGDHAF
jgi:hypothetical protein